MGIGKEDDMDGAKPSIGIGMFLRRIYEAPIHPIPTSIDHRRIIAAITL